MTDDSSPRRDPGKPHPERRVALHANPVHATARTPLASPLANPPGPEPVRGAWQEPATQIVTDRGAYLGHGRYEIGQRLADDQVELFVTGDPGIALQRQFEQHPSPFIAVHDVCTSASLRLLKTLAEGAGLPLQRLTVRRQGEGGMLLQLQFIELRLADDKMLRLYSTETHAEPAQQRSVARALLGFAGVSVLIVADSAPALLGNGLRPLREAIARGPWPNKNMLVIPMGDNAALAPLVTELPGPSDLAVHITPQAQQWAHMWAYISNTWNRVGTPALASPEVKTTAPAKTAPTQIRPARGSENTTIPGPLEVAQARAAGAQAHGVGGLVDGTAGGRVVPIATQRPPAANASPPAPTARAPRAMPNPGATPWAAYMRRCGHIKGVVAACVFDAHTGSVISAVGGPVPSPERLALQGMALLTQAGHAARALGVAAAEPDIAISAGQHHLLVRPVPGHPGVALHLMLSADTGSLTLARMHLERIESPA